MKRSVQAFEMKTLISALLDFTEPSFQGLPLCGPGKRKKVKINGKNSLDVMLRPKLQPFSVKTTHAFIRFTISDMRWPLHPCICSSSVQFSHSVVLDSLWPHESQHARPLCPSLTHGVHSDSHPLSQWCHPAISSSVVPCSSCPKSLPASKSFPMSQLFAWGGQSTGVSALASFLPKKSQAWSPSEWTGWISLQSKGLSRVFSNTTVQKHQFFGAQPSSQSNSHIHTWPQEKP